MVQVLVRVRPKNGYHYPNKIRTVTLESHTRLEDLLKHIDEGPSSLSRSSQDISLYLHGRELPLNSSIASHDLDDGVILETCKSPAISAVISAVLKDFDDVKKIPEGQRTRDVLMSTLQLPSHLLEENEENESFWEMKRWDNESITSRIICLATMKKIIQKDDRYVIDIPCCSDIQSLHRHIQPALDRDNAVRGENNNETGVTRRRWNHIGHLFTPSTKKNGKPSIIYTLLEHKLQLQIQIAADFVSVEQGSADAIEEFVRIDSLRHTDETESSNRSNNRSNRRRVPRTQRSTPMEDGSTVENDSNNVARTTPVRSPPGTPSRQRAYCPEYASGPFAILCALFEAQEGKHKNSNGRRQLSLSEHQLKILAQPRCRSNLYDRQIMKGSRNAFVCMDGMAKRNLVRKEIIRDGEERWALLPEGNRLAEACFMFEKAVDDVLPSVEITTSKTFPAPGSNNIKLIVDNREDEHYRERLTIQSRDDSIPIEERELPAGDYLFLVDETVIPLIIERKSWSDLADSVVSKGKVNRRLDCVKVGTHYDVCPRQNCQLCKMKRSGCEQIIFVIEGARCRGSDTKGTKCTEEQRCQACKALMERHGTKVTQEDLEIVLNRLQVEHGCYIHFTQSYNETISSLFAIRQILLDGNFYAIKAMKWKINNPDAIGNNVDASSSSSRDILVPQDVVGIPYDVFASNARSTSIQQQPCDKRGDILELSSLNLARFILDNSNSWQHNFRRELFSNNDNSSEVKRSRKRAADLESDNRCKSSKRQCVNVQMDESVEIIDLNESQESIVNIVGSDDESSVQLLDISPTSDGDDSVIELNDSQELNESQDSIEVIDVGAVSSVENTTRSTDQTLNDCNFQMSDSSRLILIHDMENFDVKLVRDFNAKWQECYRQLSADSTSIYEAAVTHLSDMKNNANFPYLGRHSVMKATLWVQIKLGLRVRLVFQQKVADDMKDRWKSTSPASRRTSHNELLVAGVSGTSEVCHLTSSVSQSSAGPAMPSTTARRNIMSLTVTHQTGTTTRLKPASPVSQSSAGSAMSSNITRRDIIGLNANQQTRTSKRAQSSSSALPSSAASAIPSTTARRDITSVISHQGVTTKKVLSSSSQQALLTNEAREARLRRFELSNCSNQSLNKTSSMNSPPLRTWKCKRCTLVNDGYRNQCSACDCPKSESSASTDRSIIEPQKWTCQECHYMNNSTNLKCQICDCLKFQNGMLQDANFSPSFDANDGWQCMHCSFRNESDQIGQCAVCMRPNPIATDDIDPCRPLHVRDPQMHAYATSSQYTTPVKSSFETIEKKPDITLGKRSNIKCGACGLEGHNRGTANRFNCPSYYDENEVKRREEKQRKIQEKAEIAEQEYQLLQQEEERVQNRQEELKRQIQEMTRDLERNSEIRAAEIERRRKKALSARRKADRERL